MGLLQLQGQILVKLPLGEIPDGLHYLLLRAV